MKILKNFLLQKLNSYGAAQNLKGAHGSPGPFLSLRLCNKPLHTVSLQLIYALDG